MGNCKDFDKLILAGFTDGDYTRLGLPTVTLGSLKLLLNQVLWNQPYLTRFYLNLVGFGVGYINQTHSGEKERYSMPIMEVK